MQSHMQLGASRRGMVRSEVRYAVSGAPALTGGTGFVSTLSLMAKFGEGSGSQGAGCMWCVPHGHIRRGSCSLCVGRGHTHAAGQKGVLA